MFAVEAIAFFGIVGNAARAVLVIVVCLKAAGRIGIDDIAIFVRIGIGVCFIGEVIAFVRMVFDEIVQLCL